MSPTLIGIIGCGNISDAYLTGAARSQFIKAKAVADIRTEAAQAQAAKYGVEAKSIDALLADPDIEIVINLTVPLVHAQVSRQIIDAGKHVYSEKPLAADFASGQAVLKAAKEKGVRVGCAPDTFFGASHQACRQAIDEGRIGKPVGGHAAVQSHGMEHWHPNPEFFFKRGGGPILDVGVYYVTQLVNLLGPIKSVAAYASQGTTTRTVTSEPLNGSVIDVEIATTVNGVMSFAGGANVSLSASWDVWKHRRIPFEIYGTEGSLLVPDPNFFAGTPEITQRDGEWGPLDISAHPFRENNRTVRSGAQVADYRAVGILDMAVAIQQGRPHRADGAMALHVLEVLEAFQRSSDEERHIAITTRCERPAPVPLGQDESVFAS